MVKDKKIIVNISYRNVSHYKKLGYDAIINEKIEILTTHLPTVSHVKVDVICSLCKKINNINYCKYIDNTKRHGFYSCRSCSRQKAALTSIKKYGVDNYSKTDEFKKRVEKTNIDRYGFKTNLLSPEFKEKIKNILLKKYGKEYFYEINRTNKIYYKNEFVFNRNLPINKYEIHESEKMYDDKYYLNNIHLDGYISYRYVCRKLTEINIDNLFKKWDGKDYYDGEDISSNFNLNHNDKKYPTIDHKISIYYGFNNKIDPKIISSLDNICLTKRGINSKKRDMNEDLFFKILK